MTSVLTALFLSIPAFANPIGQQKADAILNDARLVQTLSSLSRDFSAKCQVPASADLEGEVKCTGGGDASSCWYKITLACPGSMGLAAVNVEAEFFGPRPQPLNLNVTARFVQ